MMIVIKETATEEEVEAVVQRIERAGARPHLSRGARVTLIGAIGDVEQDASVESLGLEGQPGVDGLGQEGLRLLAEAQAETGMPIVTELMDIRDLDVVLEVADVIQIGARNMQNYPLIAEIGRAGKPALLKRGPSAPLDELLMAAEYILK